MRSRIEKYEIMLFAQVKNHSSYQILDNDIGSFYHFSNDNDDRHHQQHYLLESSSPLLLILITYKIGEQI